MVVQDFPPNESLSRRLERRSIPLFDQKILVVTGRGKKEEAKVPGPDLLFTKLILETLSLYSSCIRVS